jgi:hypothetical protein
LATPAELVAFAHAALGSPALSTLSTTLEQNYDSGFPGLTAKSLRKYPPQSIAMANGHLDQTRNKQRSTKRHVKPPTSPKLEEPDEFFPTSLDPGACTHFCYTACYDYSGQIFTDQTGCFIMPSSTGNNQL